VAVEVEGKVGEPTNVVENRRSSSGVEFDLVRGDQITPTLRTLSIPTSVGEHNQLGSSSPKHSTVTAGLMVGAGAKLGGITPISLSPVDSSFGLKSTSVSVFTGKSYNSINTFCILWIILCIIIDELFCFYLRALLPPQSMNSLLATTAVKGHQFDYEDLDIVVTAALISSSSSAESPTNPSVGNSAHDHPPQSHQHPHINVTIPTPTIHQRTTSLLKHTSSGMYINYSVLLYLRAP
jgi:hypothetical protein